MPATLLRHTADFHIFFVSYLCHTTVRSAIPRDLRGSYGSTAHSLMAPIPSALPLEVNVVSLSRTHSLSTRGRHPTAEEAMGAGGLPGKEGEGRNSSERMNHVNNDKPSGEEPTRGSGCIWWDSGFRIHDSGSGTGAMSRQFSRAALLCLVVELCCNL